MSNSSPRAIRRRELSREPKRKLIIVCEGIRTEKLYFEAIKRHLRLASVDIQVHHARATNPGSIIKFADNIRLTLKRDRAWGGDDQVWAVFDGIEHYRNNPRDWHKAFDIARRNSINLAIIKNADTADCLKDVQEILFGMNEVSHKEDASCEIRGEFVCCAPVTEFKVDMAFEEMPQGHRTLDTHIGKFDKCHVGDKSYTRCFLLVKAKYDLPPPSDMFREAYAALERKYFSSQVPHLSTRQSGA